MKRDIVVLHREELEELVEEAVSRGVATALENTSRSVRDLRDSFYLGKKVLSHREVAEYLGVHIATVLGYIRTGQLQAVKRGHLHWVRRDHLEAWLSAHSESKTQGEA